MQQPISDFQKRSIQRALQNINSLEPYQQEFVLRLGNRIKGIEPFEDAILTNINVKIADMGDKAK